MRQTQIDHYKSLHRTFSVDIKNSECFSMLSYYSYHALCLWFVRVLHLYNVSIKTYFGLEVCYRRSQSLDIIMDSWSRRKKSKVKLVSWSTFFFCCVQQKVRSRCGFKSAKYVCMCTCMCLVIKSFPLHSSRHGIFNVFWFYFCSICDPIPFLIPHHSLWATLMFICIEFVPVCLLCSIL